MPINRAYALIACKKSTETALAQPTATKSRAFFESRLHQEEAISVATSDSSR